MNYMISRNGEEFGPYSLSDLQRYVASGDIDAADMVRSEGMTEFLPVSQVIGTIPVPAVIPPISMATQRVEYPYPPNLPWWIVLIFEIMTVHNDAMFNLNWK